MLPFWFQNIGREQSCLALVLVAQHCSMTFCWGSSHWKLQHRWSEILWKSFQGCIIILMWSLTKLCLNLLHWLCSLLCISLLQLGRSSHTLLRNLFFPPFLTFYFILFTERIKRVNQAQNLLKTRTKILSKSKMLGFHTGIIRMKLMFRWRVKFRIYSRWTSFVW